MKSALRGKIISEVEVTNLDPQGFWLLLDDRELFVAFTQFPWFQDATVREITTVERPNAHHLRWPHLDLDLAVESIEHPERFPLMSRAWPNRPLQRTGRPRKRSRKIAVSPRRRPRR
jgi:uncharacterized protein DUF2442